MKTPRTQAGNPLPDERATHKRVDSLILEQMILNSAVGVYTCDMDGSITFHNEAVSKIWGKSPDPESTWYPGGKLYNVNGIPLAPNDFAVIKAITLGLPQENQKVWLEREDQVHRVILFSARPLLDEKQIATGVQVLVLDVTDQEEGQVRHAMLSAIVASSDDAIVSKDLNGTVRSWNKGAERIFGYSEEEMVGQSITKIIPEDRLDEETHILSQIRNGRKVDHFETIRVDKNGREFPISLTVSPIRSDQGTITGASKIARDISPQVEAQEAAKKHTQNLEILNSIGKSISGNMDLEVIMQEVTDSTTKLTGAAFGAFFYNRINDDGEAYKLFTLSGAPKEAFEKLGMPRNTAIFHTTYSGKGVVRIDDIKKDPRYGKNLPLAGMPKGHLQVRSYLGVPVVSPTGTVIGALLFGHPEKGKFKAEHEELVLNIAAQAAISLDNSKLFEQVKSLSEKKDEFIALASHELKTPLTTIKGYLQILAQKESDKMTEMFLNKTLQQVNKLNSLVEDLLNMSRAEAGKLEFNLETFDMRELLQDIAETFRLAVRSHEIITEIDDVSAVVHADKQRIEQAVNNLLNNAVKYSPNAEKVYLKLQVEGGKVRVAVQDEGIGLTTEQQKKIFTRFYRAENTNGISGLGLGLYLTKQIIERHNGTIRASSAPGEGSEFFFSLDVQSQ